MVICFLSDGERYSKYLYDWTRQRRRIRTPLTSTSTPKPAPISRKRKALNVERLDKAFGILQASSNAVNDESQSFGNFVAMKLRIFDKDVRMQLQADIMGLFLKARRVFYSQPATSSHPSNAQSLSHHASENVLFTSHLQPHQPVHYPNIPSTSSTASDSLSLSASEDSLNKPDLL
jgi:hypothetical protein